MYVPRVDIKGGGHHELPQPGNGVCEPVLDCVIRKLQNLKPDKFKGRIGKLQVSTGYRPKTTIFYYIAFFSCYYFFNIGFYKTRSYTI